MKILKNNLTTLFLTGALVLIITMSNSYDSAAGQQYREQKNSIENDIQRLSDDITSLNDQIIQQKNHVDSLEDVIDQKKENLRNIKAELLQNDSFDAVLWTEAAQKELIKAESDWKHARDELFSLYSQRSDTQAKINELNDSLMTLKRDPHPYDKSVKLIGVELATSCQNSAVCPRYHDIIQLDSSNQAVSGHFENGTRQPPPYESSWRWYDTDDTQRIIIDPPQGMSERIPLIVIVPSLDNYKIRSDMGNGTNRILYHDRYIENCNSAVISAKVWLKVLPITIYDLRNGCQSSDFEEREVIPLEKNPIDITTSPNWQAAQKLEADKIKCKGLCFEY